MDIISNEGDWKRNIVTINQNPLNLLGDEEFTVIKRFKVEQLFEKLNTIKYLKLHKELFIIDISWIML